MKRNLYLNYHARCVKYSVILKIFSRKQQVDFTKETEIYLGTENINESIDPRWNSFRSVFVKL